MRFKRREILRTAPALLTGMADAAAPAPQLSAATGRYRNYWHAEKSMDQNNEFYTIFRYTHIKNLGPEKGVSRRDPSTVIKVGDLYYVWYTKYQGPPPVGVGRRAQVSETLPLFDWDLASIWYATSRDGIDWQERGAAVHRGQKGSYDDRSVYTPEIMYAQGRYYLFYQCTAGRYVSRQFESIAMASAESPHGPWKKSAAPVLEPTRAGEWEGAADDRTKVKAPCGFDSQCVHDPCLLVRDGKYWLYYKGEPMGYKGRKDVTATMWGVAIAAKPDGPYVRHPLNPLTNSGHEVCVWPYREGVAALVTTDGPEKNTVQYAPDGLNFSVKTHVVLPPRAAGPYRPDAYTDTKNGQGITWGLCHIPNQATPPDVFSYLIRFDCELSVGMERKGMKQRPAALGEGAYFDPSYRMHPDDKPLFQP